jgi:hypothetical protein
MFSPLSPLPYPPYSPQTHSDIIQQLQSYLLNAWSHLDSLLNTGSTKLKPHMDNIGHLCDEGLSLMSSLCWDQLTSVKKFVMVGVAGLSFEEQIVTIQSEIARLTHLLKRQMFLQTCEKPVSGTVPGGSGIRKTARAHRIRRTPPISGIREPAPVSGILETSPVSGISVVPPVSGTSTAPVSGTPVTAPLGIPSIPPKPKRESLEDIEVVEEAPFSKELSTLESMGFMDREKNQRLLAEHNGDVALVVTLLLE